MHTLPEVTQASSKVYPFSGTSTLKIWSQMPDKVFKTNTLSDSRLDAKRHYVIQAKTLDGIWPVGHGCAVCATVLYSSTAALCLSITLHSTATTNCPNTFQCLGSDDTLWHRVLCHQGPRTAQRPLKGNKTSL